MNHERIEELSRLADERACKNKPAGSDYADSCNSAFAELIIEECLSVMRATAASFPKIFTFSGEDTLTAQHINAIKNHFGMQKCQKK